jgi:CrcB protein
MIRLLLVGLFGGVGALVRYGTEELVEATLPRQRAWATAGVNVVAAFLVGLAAAGVTGMDLPYGGVTGPSGYTSSTYLTLGFCGGFSTFSSAIAVPVAQWSSGRLRSVAILVGTPVLGSLAFWWGLSL